MSKYHLQLAGIFITILLFGSFSFLSFKQYQQSDPNLNKDWWSLYFENPKGNDLDFMIENHSNNDTFAIEIYSQNTKISETTKTIAKGASFRFPIKSEDLTDRKITISVKSNDQTREIYKIIQ